MMRVRIMILLAVMFFSTQAASENRKYSIELQGVQLADAIRLIAKSLHCNVVLSPHLQGMVNLHLSEVNALEAFNMLLTMYELEKWQVGNIMYVAPRSEIMKHKQTELSLKLLQEESQPLLLKIWQIQYGSAQDIARIIQNTEISLLSKRGHVRVDTRTNSLCVQDIADRLEGVYRLIKQLDVPVKQVLIKARIATIDKDYEHELGVFFTAKSGTSLDNGAMPVKSLTRDLGNYSVAISRLVDNTLLDLRLSALEQAGHAEIISNPSLFTANQQAASIEAGEEVPYQEITDRGGTAVVFKKAVLGLKVVPYVLPGGRVLLQLQINQDRPTNRLVQGVPTISTHQIKTNVLVKNGQTVALGGVYEFNQEAGESQLPYMSQLPVIGNVFKQQVSKRTKRELVIFVTPKIIN